MIVSHIRFAHPWTDELGWVTQVWSTSSHAESNELAKTAAELGWGIWLIANIGAPGLVVYRKTDQAAEK